LGNKTRSLDKVRTNQVVVRRRTRYDIKCIHEMARTEEQFSIFNIFIRF
jgi:hypothetical protein